MRAYSNDLRASVIEACLSGDRTQREVAEVFGVSLPFVQKVLARYRDTGDRCSHARGGRRLPAFDAKAVKRLRRRVKERPDATLEELREYCGVECSLVTVHNTLKRLGYRRKKNAAR
jgi:transposase